MPVFAFHETVLFGFGFGLGPLEMMLFLGVALLLYGGRLPEVARSWGKSFTEFRQGLSGIQNEINEAIYAEPDRLEYHESSPQEEQQADSSSNNNDDNDNFPNPQSEPRNQEGD